MWSWPTQFPILKALTSTAGVGEGIRPASSSASDWQLAKESLGGWRRGGKELVQPGLLLVCSEANCWENPMTLKPSLSLRTEKNRSQNKAPSGNMPDSRDKQPVGLGYSLVGSCRAGQGWWR